LETVPTVTNKAFIAEKVGNATEMVNNNASLRDKVRRIFADAEYMTLPYEEILGQMAAQAKVIVRTGAFDPWGNILLYSSVDVPKWFDKPGVIAPEYHAKRLNQG
jgi:simple sugar transport system permease protein/D-ribose pyranase